MLLPYSPTEALRFPVTAGTAVLAVGVSWLAITGGQATLDMAVMHPAFWPGQPWRVLTCLLAHLSLLDLFFNVYWLWVMGTFIEREFGHARTAMLLVVSGAASAMATYAFSVGSAGLFGAVCGLLGFCIVLGRRTARYGGVVDRFTLLIFGVWLLLSLGSSRYDLVHFGLEAIVGALSGGLMALVMIEPGRHIRRAAGALLGLLLGALAAMTTAAHPLVNLEPDSMAGWLAEEAHHAGQTGNYARSAELLRRALAYKPDSEYYWRELAESLEAMGRSDQAAEATRRAEAIKAGQSDKAPADEPAPASMPDFQPLPDVIGPDGQAINHRRPSSQPASQPGSQPASAPAPRPE